MKTIILGDNKYEIIEDYREAFDSEVLTEAYTDYFNDYDYIIGDIAYNKLRLKGFFDHDNPKCKKENDFDNKDNYINNYCAYGCRYFILKKINK